MWGREVGSSKTMGERELDRGERVNRGELEDEKFFI